MGAFETAATGIAFMGAGGAGIWYFDPSVTDSKRYQNKNLWIMSIVFVIIGAIMLVGAGVGKYLKVRDAASGVPTQVAIPGSATNPGGVTSQGVPIKQ